MHKEKESFWAFIYDFLTVNVDTSDMRHWHALTFICTTGLGPGYTCQYIGTKNRRITKSDIDDVEIPFKHSEKALVSLSYLGWMPKDEFLGVKDE